MALVQILILAVIQGAAELLPVSSSAHVIVAEKLMGLDPTRPEMTLLLVMLHTGTMFAVIFFFWQSWKTNYFASRKVFLGVHKTHCLGDTRHGYCRIIIESLYRELLIKRCPPCRSRASFWEYAFNFRGTCRSWRVDYFRWMDK